MIKINIDDTVENADWIKSVSKDKVKESYETVNGKEGKYFPLEESTDKVFITKRSIEESIKNQPLIEAVISERGSLVKRYGGIIKGIMKEALDKKWDEGKLKEALEPEVKKYGTYLWRQSTKLLGVNKVLDVKKSQKFVEGVIKYLTKNFNERKEKMVEEMKEKVKESQGQDKGKLLLSKQIENEERQTKILDLKLEVLNKLKGRVE